MMSYIFLILVAFLINIAFGYFRGAAIKFSLPWFFWIHVSIPVLIYLRVILKIAPWFIPVSILAAILGQMLGNRFHNLNCVNLKSLGEN